MQLNTWKDILKTSSCVRVSEFALGRHVSTLQATREPQDLLRSDEFWC